MNTTALIEILGKSMESLKLKALEGLPNVIIAIVLLLVGLVVARLMKSLVSRLVKGLDRMVTHKGVQAELRRARMSTPAAELISSIAFWILILFFVTAATEALGLPVISAWLSGLTVYLPKLLAAVLIGFAGLVTGRLAKEAVRTAAEAAEFSYAEAMGRLGQVLIWVVSGVVGIHQIGVDVSFLTNLTMVVLAAALGGAALAFGIGSRSTVANILACHYIQKVYRVGQTIRVDGQEGTIASITPTAVVVENGQGWFHVPAQKFSEETSMLIETTGVGGTDDPK